VGQRFLARLERFWQTDRGLTVLLGSLVAVIFILPSVAVQDAPAPGLLVQVTVQVLFTLIFMSGISAATHNRGVLAVASVIMGAAIALFWIYQFAPSARLAAWRAGVGVVAAIQLIVVVMLQVLHEGPITFHRIRGAVAVYLLLGLAWANLYELIEQLSPGAFRLPDAPRNHAELVTMLAYYSFVTLTTMGYGDVLPVHPAARSAAVLEAVVGQLFPAILIARLVSMELTSREARR
jgi:hypothetical protein